MIHENESKNEYLAGLADQIIEVVQNGTNTLMVILSNIGLAKTYVNNDTEKAIEKLVEAEKAVMLVKKLLLRLGPLAESREVDITEPHGKGIPFSSQSPPESN